MKVTFLSTTLILTIFLSTANIQHAAAKSIQTSVVNEVTSGGLLKLFKRMGKNMLKIADDWISNNANMTASEKRLHRNFIHKAKNRLNSEESIRGVYNEVNYVRNYFNTVVAREHRVILLIRDFDRKLGRMRARMGA